MTVRTNQLPPALFLELYQSVGWEAPGLDQIETAVENSFATFCAYDGETPAGMARLLGDGGMSFYIKDFAVRTEYQGKGAVSVLAPETEMWGQRTCYIADPEGNLIEIGSFNRPFSR